MTAVYSIIQKSQLEGALRLDAEYYQPEFLKLKSLLESRQTNKIIEISNFVKKGIFDLSPDNYRENGVPFVRVQNIRKGFLSEESLVFIPEEAHQKEKKTELASLDLVLSKVGTVGEISIIPSHLKKVNFSQNVVGVKVKKEKILPGYLLTYLLSKFGQLQVARVQMLQVQPKLELHDVRELQIVRLGKAEEQIHRNILEIERLQQEAKALYSQAEEMLLEELGLSSFAKATEDEELFCIVNFSEIQSANRMDAEYFQPKYDKLISKIKSQATKTLEALVKSYSTGFPFRSENYQEKGIPLIRINNIKRGSLDLNDTAYLSERDYLLSPKDTAKPGDIVLSMSGTIGMSTLIPNDIPRCSINQRILRFKPKEIDENYLVLLLNSIVGTYQLARIGTGGVQTNISYKDIKKILIPILSKETQQKIAELVIESHEARKKAKELFGQAKHKVEEMIESQPKQKSPQQGCGALP